MTIDLTITGGTVVTAAGQTRVSLGIDRGKIVAIAQEDALPAAQDSIDATGLYVLPGVIDTHVHVRDPGRLDREDFYSATAAAAASGITTIMEMPIATPAVHSAQVLKERIAAVQEKALVDYAFYGAAGPDNLDSIPALAEAGVIAFKTFRTAKPPGREQEFIGLTCPHAGDFLRVLEKVAPTGKLLVIHAEEQQILDRIAADLLTADRSDALLHARSRPEVVETASVAQCLALAKAAGARIQIAHCSTALSIDLIADARANGLRVSAETCPQYLFLTEAELQKHGPFAKCNPALRTAESVEALWERVRAGGVEVIGTDHSPFLATEKAAGQDDITQAPPGMPGLEAFLPLMLTTVNDGRLTLETMAALISENAARLFDIFPRKGTIRIGSDADLVLVDLGREGKIDIATWHSKSRDSARVWDGFATKGAPVSTMVRGKLVAQNNRIVAEPGWGQFTF